MAMELRLFIGGIKKADALDVRQYFESLGFVVLQAQVQKDQDTGREKGYGFVTISSEMELAQIVAKCSRARLEAAGGVPTVNSATPKAPKQAHYSHIDLGMDNRR